jgi:hypothetical protein
MAVLSQAVSLEEKNRKSWCGGSTSSKQAPSSLFSSQEHVVSNVYLQSRCSRREVLRGNNIQDDSGGSLFLHFAVANRQTECSSMAFEPTKDASQ